MAHPYSLGRYQWKHSREEELAELCPWKPKTKTKEQPRRGRSLPDRFLIMRAVSGLILVSSHAVIQGQTRCIWPGHWLGEYFWVIFCLHRINNSGNQRCYWNSSALPYKWRDFFSPDIIFWRDWNIKSHIIALFTITINL